MLPIIIAGMIYCRSAIPSDMRTEEFRSPFGTCSTCLKIDDFVKFNVFTRRNLDNPDYLRPNDDETLTNSNFNRDFPTVMFAHGFTGSVAAESSQSIKNAYLADGDYNIIIIDWGKLAAGPNYCKAVGNIPVVGEHAAKLVEWLMAKGMISLPKLHVIGFSLGAHVSALIGEQLIKRNLGKIGRITGLDPAGPAFDRLTSTSNGLDKEDATFVDIVHTNTYHYGFEAPIGHADFYVNGGKTQPGCTIGIGCSHERAWKYYSESISNPTGFRGIVCKFWKPVVNTCRHGHDNHLGFGINREIHGIFSVKTNDKAPFTMN